MDEKNPSSLLEFDREEEDRRGADEEVVRFFAAELCWVSTVTSDLMDATMVTAATAAPAIRKMFLFMVSTLATILLISKHCWPSSERAVHEHRCR